MQTKRIYFFTIILVTLFASCEIDTYLDKTPTGGMTDELVFNTYRHIDQALANIYSELPDEWQPTSSQTFSYAAASDEAMSSMQESNGPHMITNGSLSSTVTPLNRWSSLYAAIRKTNLFLDRIQKFTPKNADEATGVARMRGEAYFLRAFFYYELFRQYGGVPLINQVLNITDDLNLARNTARETVAFIVDDCDAAASLLLALPTSINVGRATKGAALMLKTRALITMASPLHNPNNDIEIWKVAASAAQSVIDLGVYSVDGDYNGLFNRRNTSNIIFQSTINLSDWPRRQFTQTLAGMARIQPLQNIVDAYEMQSTGKSIKESGSGYDENKPYEGRDPRFYSSIIYDGANWKGRTILTHEGSGVDAIIPAGASLNTRTGYYLAKTLDESANVAPNPIAGSHFWIYMRYEDLLLLYAEAQNESLSTPDASVYKALNNVRTRVGVNMPAVEMGLSKAQMRIRIRHERRIELAFESQRFWDIRRWKIGLETLNNARGMRITLSGGKKDYQPFTIEDRIFRPEYYLFPIPLSEIEKQTNLTQNENYN